MPTCVNVTKKVSIDAVSVGTQTIVSFEPEEVVPFTFRVLNKIEVYGGTVRTAPAKTKEESVARSKRTVSKIDSIKTKKLTKNWIENVPIKQIGSYFDTNFPIKKPTVVEHCHDVIKEQELLNDVDNKHRNLKDDSKENKNDSKENIIDINTLDSDEDNHGILNSVLSVGTIKNNGYASYTKRSYNAQKKYQVKYNVKPKSNFVIQTTEDSDLCTSDNEMAVAKKPKSFPKNRGQPLKDNKKSIPSNVDDITNWSSYTKAIDLAVERESENQKRMQQEMEIEEALRKNGNYEL